MKTEAAKDVWNAARQATPPSARPYYSNQFSTLKPAT